MSSKESATESDDYSSTDYSSSDESINSDDSQNKEVRILPLRSFKVFFILELIFV